MLALGHADSGLVTILHGDSVDQTDSFLDPGAMTGLYLLATSEFVVRQKTVGAAARGVTGVTDASVTALIVRARQAVLRATSHHNHRPLQA